MTPQDSDWLGEAQRIAALPLPPRKLAYLRYAMGKYFDDVCEFDQAFDNFRRANELTTRIRPARDPQAMTRAVDRIIESEDREWLGRARSAPTGSEQAVFIVGMLRSGTTLAEQILASHPQVFGAGELPFWNAAADAVRSAPDHPGRELRLESQAVDYLRLASHLARYYGEYLRVMEHWRSVLPPHVMLDVPYEALVQDPERWSRRMIEHIGLPWNSHCLDSHLTARTVITASKWQVRQPITTAAVGRWRHYRVHVGPLLGLLGR
jgi:hypothetical protein